MDDTAHPWPLFGLRIRSAGLELRLPTDADLAALASLAGDDDHPIQSPGGPPMIGEWTGWPGPERARYILQRHWRHRGAWQEEDWALALVAVCDDEVVGVQEVRAESFAVAREVATGSWVGGAHQGRGISTAMRRAVLHLSFAGLGAQSARSAAFVDNVASVAVSDRVGYRRDGAVAAARRGARVEELRFVMHRADWEAQRRSWPPVELVGLEPCLDLFGLA